MRVSRGTQAFLQFQGAGARIFPMRKRCLNFQTLKIKAVQGVQKRQEAW